MGSQVSELPTGPVPIVKTLDTKSWQIATNAHERALRSTGRVATTKDILHSLSAVGLDSAVSRARSVMNEHGLTHSAIEQAVGPSDGPIVDGTRVAWSKSALWVWQEAKRFAFDNNRAFNYVMPEHVLYALLREVLEFDRDGLAAVIDQVSPGIDLHEMLENIEDWVLVDNCPVHR